MQNNNDEKPDHLETARQVLQHINQDNIFAAESCIWLWRNTGIWRPILDRELLQLIQKSLASLGHKIYNTHVRAIMDVIKTEIYTPEHIWNLNNNNINLLNGELFCTDGIWQLKKHCREDFRTTQIPLKYNAQAKCPRFIKFLDEIFNGDPDAKDKIQVLLELIGYTLISHTNMERFVLLVGAGANGKSVILELIRSLVGQNNVCAVQPAKFNNSFQRAHMHRKLANLISEIPEGAMIADAELKAITSGELITAEHKGKNPFEFKPFCTCWFGTNHMPHTRDFSGALLRRAIIIPFNQTFREGINADPELKNKLKSELPGILNLALHAYSNVLKNSKFTEPQSCIKAKENWRMEIDQIALFVQEKCILENNHKTRSETLYKEYTAWTIDAGIKRKLSHKSFSQRLVRLGCELHSGTGGIRMVHGIYLN